MIKGIERLSVLRRKSFGTNFWGRSGRLGIDSPGPMFFPGTVHPRTVSEVFFCRMRQSAIFQTFWDCHWWILVVHACQDSLEQEVLMVDDFPKATLPSIC